MSAKWTLPVLLLTTVVATGQTTRVEPQAVKHPVLKHDVDPKRAAAYERSVRRVMAMTEDEMLELVPTKSCIMFCGCPNCSGGQQENGQFDWTIERPFELRCRFCEHRFPSETYPMTATASGKNALGETVTYRYYLDEKTGRDYWLEAAADRLRRAWFVKQCQSLAACYHATKKPTYARRSALILHRFAEAYPNMAVLSQWPYRRRAVAKPTPPYPSAGGKWGRWMAEEVPHGLAEAYDLIHESPELDKLSQERGVDVRRRIENDFFRATVEYAFTFGKEPIGRHLNNMAPFYTRNIIQIGRVIGEPEYVHWGHRWVREILREGFFYDGMWHEAPSYHYQTIGGVRRVIAALEGYSDPPGYQSPTDGLRLENVDLEKEVPFVAKALDAPSTVAYPNGRICPAHDTWATSRTSPARHETVSTLLPGFGQASLGRGAGDDQFQAQLHFSGGYGHEHADNLNLALFAKGAEMLSDVGYTHTKLRRWTTSTVGHNTVVVDRRDQTTRDSDGDLLLFLPDAADLSVCEARAPGAYPQLTEIYRRLLLLVPVSQADAYLVDLFRVEGGTIHDWVLHGSADDEMTAECSLPLTAREGTLLEPGETWTEPLGESSSLLPYGLIRQVRQAEALAPFHVTFRYTGTKGPTADAGVRVHLLAGPATEVFLGQSPRVRPAEGDDRTVYDYWMPQLVVRRRGPAPLEGVFAAVHEPFRPEPFLTKVAPLALDPPDDDAVALKVHHGDLVDTIVSTLDEPPYPERRLPGGIRIRGRLAVVRQRAGRVVAAWLIDGSLLSRNQFSLTCKTPRITGVIESATRRADGADADTFVTAAELPPGETLAGQWMILTHSGGHTHAYEISSVERRDGKSIVSLCDDHGLKIADGATEECYFPRRKFTGPNRFHIINWATEQPAEM